MNYEKIMRNDLVNSGIEAVSREVWKLILLLWNRSIFQIDQISKRSVICMFIFERDSSVKFGFGWDSYMKFILKHLSSPIVEIKRIWKTWYDAIKINFN